MIIILAVFHAMFNDGSSGGVCRIGIITKNGIERRTYYAPIQPLASDAQFTAGPSAVGV